ncbi:Uncharacterized protein TCM_011298 [Theobroma cacao]|uniref:Uncharacterized protein n=1 Tax=Theobroma cacao TaxID=3641 RepID=A0A061E9S3_THECC|nr:Uncharacterized protein TCM_011298 [Theobroma cacao]
MKGVLVLKFVIILEIVNLKGVVVTFRILHSGFHWFLTLQGLHSPGQVINHSPHLCQLSLLGLIASTSTSSSTNHNLLTQILIG